MNKSVPFNTEAEMYVLGSVFLDNKIISGYIGKLIEDDFYDERNKLIYQAMVYLHHHNEKIEVLTVIEAIKRLEKVVDDNFRVYLLDLIDLVPSTANTNMYLQIVEEKSIERKLLKDMGKITDDILYGRLSFNEIIDKTEDTVLNVIKKRKTSDFIRIDAAGKNVYDQIRQFKERTGDLTGLDTGFPNLNRTTLGFQNGDLMILAARPSVGKSTYAINLALNIAKSGKSVAFFSLEMSIEQLMMRIFSCHAELELSNIRSGQLTPQEMLLLGIAQQELSKINLYFDESSSSNLAEIRSKCRQLYNEGKLDFIIIDYLQLITINTNRGNRQEEVSQISRSLKTIARELNVPILALSQLSRGIESREDKRPTLSDLRESGSIEQDADLVMFLYRRNDVEDKESLDDLIDSGSVDKEKTKNEVQEIILSIAKNRQGPLDYFDYHFFGHYCRFNEQPNTKRIIPKKKRGRGSISERKVIPV